jgi:hypothetical protein
MHQVRRTHFDRSMCVEKGWVKLQYLDLVEGSDTVCQMSCDLYEYSTHADISERFIFDLIDFGADSIKAAWLLALLRARNNVYHPPPTQRRELAAVDYNLLRSAYDLAQANDKIRDCSQTYWGDTVTELGFG